MIWSKKQLVQAIRDALNSPTDEKENAKSLREELEKLKLEKKMAETEIKHLVKIKEEQQAIELNKKEIEMSKAFQEKEMALQRNYHDKVLKTIDEGANKLQEIYKEIIERLPNVNLDIKRKQ